MGVITALFLVGARSPSSFPRQRCSHSQCVRSSVRRQATLSCSLPSSPGAITSAATSETRSRPSDMTARRAASRSPRTRRWRRASHEANRPRELPPPTGFGSDRSSHALRRLGLVKVTGNGRCNRCGKSAQAGAKTCLSCRKARLHGKRRKRRAEPRRGPAIRRPEREPDPMDWTE